MIGEIQRMIRGATGGAALGAGVGGALFGAIGGLLVGLEPIVILVCGVYTGAVYGGIVGAVHSARQQPLDSETGWAAAPSSRLELVPAVVRSRNS